MAYQHNLLDPPPGVIVTHHNTPKWQLRPASPDMDAMPLDTLHAASHLNMVNIKNTAVYFREHIRQALEDRLKEHCVHIDRLIETCESHQQFYIISKTKLGIFSFGKSLVPQDPLLAADRDVARACWTTEKGHAADITKSAGEHGHGVSVYHKYPLPYEMERQVQDGNRPPPPPDWPDYEYRAPAESVPSGSWANPLQASRPHRKLQKSNTVPGPALPNNTAGSSGRRDQKVALITESAAKLQRLQRRHSHASSDSSGERSRTSTEAPEYVEDINPQHRVPSMIANEVDRVILQSADNGTRPRADLAGSRLAIVWAQAPGQPPPPFDAVAGMPLAQESLTPSASPAPYSPQGIGQLAGSAGQQQLFPGGAGSHRDYTMMHVTHARGPRYRTHSESSLPSITHIPQEETADRVNHLMQPPRGGDGGGHNPYGNAEAGPGPSSRRFGQ